MILSCPECWTRFRIVMDKLSPQGSRLRCSKCEHLFTATPLDGEAENPQERQVQETLQDQTPLMEETEEEDPSYNLEQSIKFKKPGKKFFWGLIVGLLLLLAGTGYYFFPQWQHLIPGQDRAAEEKLELDQRDMVQEQNLQELALQDVRQYMVQNENFGQLLVVEGRVLNDSQSPKKMIKLKATLYDEQDQILDKKKFFCGNTVSLFQLQVMELSELESALESRVGVLTHNSNVVPGQGVEFMQIFPNPPEELAEFSLEVIHAEDVQEASDGA